MYEWVSAWVWASDFARDVWTGGMELAEVYLLRAEETPEEEFILGEEWSRYKESEEMKKP